MAEVKVKRDYSTLAKFREVVEAYQAYDLEARNELEEIGEALAQGKRLPPHRSAREEVLLQDLERKTLAWLQLVLKP